MVIIKCNCYTLKKQKTSSYTQKNILYQIMKLYDDKKEEIMI